jgi:predicted DNA-binding transcriptional regulator AlpA
MVRQSNQLGDTAMNMNFSHVRPQRLEYLTISALAGELDTSTRTIRRWVAQGTLPQPKRIGRSCYWSTEEIRKAISEKSAK